MSNRIEQLETIQQEAKDLFLKKNQDYGDAFANCGPIGVLVRIGDKLQRLQSISRSGITLVQDEKLRDSLIDLHNYAAMAIMLLDNPEEQKNPKEATPKKKNVITCSTCLKGASTDDTPAPYFVGKYYCCQACFNFV
jgi:hypothetical protein